jgi:hypothetical protein
MGYSIVDTPHVHLWSAHPLYITSFQTSWLKVIENLSPYILNNYSTTTDHVPGQEVLFSGSLPASMYNHIGLYIAIYSAKWRVMH